MVDKELKIAERAMGRFIAVWKRRFKSDKFLRGNLRLAELMNNKLNELMPLLGEIKQLDKALDKKFDAARYRGLEKERRGAAMLPEGDVV